MHFLFFIVPSGVPFDNCADIFICCMVCCFFTLSNIVQIGVGMALFEGICYESAKRR